MQYICIILRIHEQTNIADARDSIVLECTYYVCKGERERQRRRTRNMNYCLTV